MVAEIAWAGGSSSVHVLDISAHGARLHSPTPIIAPRIRLKYSDFTIGGVVVWSEHKKLGIKFDGPVSDATVAAFNGGLGRSTSI